MNSTKKPKVIFLDAVGTIFGVKDSVGSIYSQLAYQFGVKVDPNILNDAFFQSYEIAPPMTFPGAPLELIPELELQWWQEITRQTFELAGVLSQFADFTEFFQYLYNYFATDAPWFVYPDVKPTLAQWQAEGLPLALLSNFDSRLYRVLQSLGLANFFNSVTISTEVGSAKPDRLIFLTALAKHNCDPSLALHIGDSYQADYQGALAVGMDAVWLDRTGQNHQLSNISVCLTT